MEVGGVRVHNDSTKCLVDLTNDGVCFGVLVVCHGSNGW
jgi:hypothetical protein